MKKLLFIVLLSSLVLAGCAQQGLSQSELFEKKQECNDLYQEAVNYYGDRIDGESQIFYSPIKNTCFFSFFGYPEVPSDYDPENPVNSVTPMFIVDWLTKEEYDIVYSNYPEREKKIQELKWE